MIKEPETAEEINEAISDYTNLLSNSGWKRVVAQCEANIEILRRQLETGLEEEDMDTINRIRDKIRLLKEIKDTPQNMIDKLSSPETPVDNPDPFDTEEDIQKRRKVDNPKK